MGSHSCVAILIHVMLIILQCLNLLLTVESNDLITVYSGVLKVFLLWWFLVLQKLFSFLSALSLSIHIYVYKDVIMCFGNIHQA